MKHEVLLTIASLEDLKAGTQKVAQEKQTSIRGESGIFTPGSVVPP